MTERPAPANVMRFAVAKRLDPRLMGV